MSKIIFFFENIVFESDIVFIQYDVLKILIIHEWYCRLQQNKIIIICLNIYK